jgi:uncharacterized protein YgbK (DUF1537 family)
MIDTLIIADDLSGAADCAIACVKAGAKTVVVVDVDGDPHGGSAVAVDVNSRSMARNEAEAAVAAAVERFYGTGTRRLYQKMDSTLRGHWAAETVRIREAAAKVLGRAPLAIVAPAFPGTGRATIDGHVFVTGTPLEDTEAWKQAGSAGTADLRVFLTAAGLKAELAKLEQVALGADALKSRLVKWADAGTEAVVCDAQNEDDLLTIAKASLALPEKVLWVGSAGLMRALVAADAGPPFVSSPIAQPATTKPILFVVGSASRTSRGQFAALTEDKGVTPLIVPPSALRPGADRSAIRVHAQALDEALASGSDVAIAIGEGEEPDLDKGSQLAAALAELVAPHLAAVGGLVATGGETARAILVRGGISALGMQGEIEPGVPVGFSVGDIVIPVITKAGAFGDRKTLIRCRAALRGDRSDRADPATVG